MLDDRSAEGDKAHQLKVFQAWLDLKTKVAGWVLIGNGVALTTAVAFIKDKGLEMEGLFVLKFSAIGITLAAFALMAVKTFADGYLIHQLEPQKPPTTKLRKWFAGERMTLAVANRVFRCPNLPSGTVPLELRHILQWCAQGPI